MSHKPQHPQHEPMEDWVVWAGVATMGFTIIVFVAFTLSIIYWG